MNGTIRWMTLLAMAVVPCCGCTGGGGGGDGDGSSKLGTGEGPCDAAEECAGDVCVALIDGDNPPIYCTEVCGDGCPGGFFCDDQTFALVGLDFCRFGESDPEPAPPPEPPRLPCRTDADCADRGLVCATFMDERDCTLPCSREEDCTPPSLGGYTFDFYGCGNDQTEGADRLVCLPDVECFEDPFACM